MEFEDHQTKKPEINSIVQHLFNIKFLYYHLRASQHTQIIKHTGS